MNIKKRTICLIVVLITIVSGINASNSVFSVYGFPNRNSGNDVYARGMGDVGMGDGLRLSYGYGNPALINTSTTVNFYTSIKTGYVTYKTKSIESSDDNLDFPVFSIVVPYRKNRFAFQFTSYSSGDFENELEIGEKNYISSYVYKIDLLYGYRFNGGWSVGIAPNILIGHRNREYIQTNEVNNGEVNPWYKSKTSFDAVNCTFGVLKQGSSWSFGARYELGQNISAEKEYFSLHNNERLNNVKFELPHRVGFGFAKKWGGCFKLASDFDYEIWSDYENKDKHNSWKAGVGIAYEPKLGEKKIWKKIPIRTGFSLKELPFDSNDNKVIEKSLTFGISLPLKTKIDKFDFALEFSDRGNVTDNLMQDKSVMFMFGISGFDIFKRVYKRYEPRVIPEKEEGF